MAARDASGSERSVAEVKFWKYEPFNGKHIVIRSEATRDANRGIGKSIQPGVVLHVSEEVLFDGVTYLRLADGRGWIFDKSVDGVMCNKFCALGNPNVSFWTYQPFNGAWIMIRSEPTRDANRGTYASIMPGTVLHVSEELMLDGVTYLRLADGRGWLFDKSTDGVMCEKLGDKSEIGVRGQKRARVGSNSLDCAVDITLWRYEPYNGLAISVRSEPSRDVSKGTDKSIQPGASLDISEELLIGDVTYLRLADGRGWLFDKSLDGVMCKANAVAQEVSAVAQEPASKAARKTTSNDTHWKYEPFHGLALAIQSEPTRDANKGTAESIQPGAVVCVSEEHFIDDVTYLRLADGRGWIFDKSVDGVMCKKASNRGVVFAGIPKCILCTEAPLEATFVHGSTGHTACCLRCAEEIQKRGAACPICRQPFSAVIRNFVVM